MKIDLINNSELVSLKDELEFQMKRAKSFDIATAFISNEAIELINIFLNENKTRLRMGRLITGFYNCFNSQEVLIKLQELAKHSKGRLLVHISRNEWFHWKYYNFETNNQDISFIGSANFTGAGMNDKGELVLKLSLNNRDKSDRKNIKDLFKKEFENSVDITKIPLEDYEQSESAKTNSKGLPPSIRNILLSQEKTKPNKKAKTQILVIKIDGYISNKTEKIIQEKKSEWYKNKWDYFCCEGQSDYDASLKIERIFIIWCFNRKYSFSIVEVIGNCQIRTPDGNHFIAYKVIKNINKESITLKAKLEGLGLRYHTHKKFKEKTLRNRKTEQLLSLFPCRK